MAYCNFCSQVYRADPVRNGTKNMNLHYPICKGNPMNEERLKQQKLCFTKKENNGDGEGCSNGTLQNWKYDEKAIKRSLIELIVLAELPFKFVEHPAFIKYSNSLQPKYNLPSRHIISRDVSKFYIEEKKKLLKFLGNPNHTIHLTTYTWTSTCQKINYMVITAHFVDDGWVMYKRVINFKRVNSHRGEDIGRHLPGMYDNGKHFHIRCMAHILNLVVKDGLKVHEKAVETIGSAVKSNSTYDMLKSAIDLEEAFYNYSFKNACFSRDLESISRRSDFDACQRVCDFLEKFKEITELVSTQSSPVAHLFYSEILDVDKHLREWEVVPNFDKMVENMRIKYDKYCRDYKKINHYMYFAVLLDPTMKSEMLGYGLRHLMENGCIPEENEFDFDTPLEFLTDREKEDKIEVLVSEVETNMGVLFGLYNDKYGTKSSGVDDELRKYLKEPPIELDDEEDFDILLWWKVNSPRFPIVSKMAKEALLSTQSWVRTSQKSIYMDDLEDLMKDEEVIKGIGQIKARQWKWKLKVYLWMEKNPFCAFGVSVKLKECLSGFR
ncbi:zinc finger BED domain-containing protein RICESLEEPER 2 [Artemisia annua]|uniref:Zinc finger BED domain-containing protein RICESLEEPER 2 n=1 Tax=Artemisia annua TaxID=35608 RepID=A0A2U1N7X1_ARTAN|nr:zinc finger BED domain-containing protein RICESLEEPER 2 [Artemisia annua]